MKILICNDGYHAHYFERLAWARAFSSLGHKVLMWDCKNVPAFDVFNSFDPDIFLGQTYNLDRATYKCIENRPYLKVALRAGDWPVDTSKVEESKKKLGILFAGEEEKAIVEKLKRETGQPEFVHIHYDYEDVKNTHGGWENMGVQIAGILMSADVQEYINSEFMPELACDIGFVGGYWPYKGQVIDRFLVPMFDKTYNIKIFGNQPWPFNEYCGFIEDKNVKNLFRSAKICPNLSEPHAQILGIDINERCFKILCAGGFCISDPVAGIARLFENRGVVMSQDPEHFHGLVDYYLDKPKEREEISMLGRNEVLTKHTNYHRAGQILEKLGYEGSYDSVVKAWNKIRIENGI